MKEQTKQNSLYILKLLKESIMSSYNAKEEKAILKISKEDILLLDKTLTDIYLNYKIYKLAMKKNLIKQIIEFLEFIFAFCRFKYDLEKEESFVLINDYSIKELEKLIKKLS